MKPIKVVQVKAVGPTYNYHTVGVPPFRIMKIFFITEIIIFFFWNVTLGLVFVVGQPIILEQQLWLVLSGSYFGDCQLLPHPTDFCSDPLRSSY